MPHYPLVSVAMYVDWQRFGVFPCNLWELPPYLLDELRYIAGCFAEREADEIKKQQNKRR